MAQDDLEKICVWKLLLEDSDSSSGRDMKRYRRRAELCFKCDGTREYAEKLKCSAYEKCLR